MQFSRKILLVALILTIGICFTQIALAQTSDVQPRAGTTTVSTTTTSAPANPQPTPVIEQPAPGSGVIPASATSIPAGTSAPRPTSVSNAPKPSPVLIDQGIGNEILSPTRSTQKTDYIQENTLLITSAAALGLLGVFLASQLRPKKKTSKSSNKDSDGQKCDDIKSLLEIKKKEMEEYIKKYPEHTFNKKVNEVTGAAVKLAIETASQNKTAKVVIESMLEAKKRYDQMQKVIEILQTKYDLCMLRLPGLSGMEKAVIFDLNGVLVQSNANTEETAALIETIKKLKEKGVKIFALSNIEYNAAEYHSKFVSFLDGIAQKVYYSEHTGFVKPHPKAYEHILDENKLKPEDCIYFDDMHENVEAAKKLGIKSFVYEGVDQIKKLLN